jgi:hypothetical protein
MEGVGMDTNRCLLLCVLFFNLSVSAILVVAAFVMRPQWSMMWISLANTAVYLLLLRKEHNEELD